jgi:hypothetical protein
VTSFWKAAFFASTRIFQCCFCSSAAAQNNDYAVKNGDAKWKQPTNIAAAVCKSALIGLGLLAAEILQRPQKQKGLSGNFPCPN